MNKTVELCADIGCVSVNHVDEQLCGDHVAVVDAADGSTIIVLADGLGSGVKACILSTLTSKIISTMLAAGMELQTAVETIVATLPVCSVRGVAYSTFTVLRIVGSTKVEIIQYDNPKVVILRDGKPLELPVTTTQIGGKSITRTETPLQIGDLFLAFSDGVEHAGAGGVYNFGWKRSDITDFMSTFWDSDFTAKTLATILLDETIRLYENRPADDATVCAVRIRQRKPLNLLIGPPSNPDDCGRMMALFFAKGGKHIVCGGTTSTIAAQYLQKPLIPCLDFCDPEIPPTAKLEGVDLVTEGVITLSKVLAYAKDYLADNHAYAHWSYQKDGASRIAQLLFEEATDIHFFVGRAINPAHQNPQLPIHFNIKMQLVEELTDCLKKMGKTIQVNYF